MYDDLSAYTQRLVKGGIEYRRDASKDERLWTLVSSTLSSDPGNVSSLDEITQALRVVRNACAGVAETQDLVVQKQIHESIINLLRRLSHEAPTELHHLVALQAGAQALSNILTANSHAQDVIFPVLLTNKAASVDAEPGSDNPQSEAHVPESNLLADLLAIDDPKLTQAVLMLLYNSVLNSHERCAMLCAKHVRPLLELLLNRLTSHLGTTTTTDTNSAEDDGTTSQDPVYQLMYGIFSNIISLDLSPSLLGTLRPPSSSKSILTPHQLSFLKILDGHIHSTSTSQQPADAAEDPLAILPLNTTLHLCHILHTTSSRATDYLFGLRDATGDSLLTQLQAQPRDATAPRDEVAPLDLEGLIVTLGVLAAIGESADTTVKEEISKQGTVGDLISLLRDLNLFQTRTKPSSDAAPNAARTGAAKSPLFMLKSEVVTVLSNLCHECAVVQDEIRERDAIPLILEQCNLDDANPFLREHAILLVRNLCTGNTANQDYIRSLEAQKVVVSEDLLDTVGGRLQIDAAGKVQLKRG